MTKNTYLIFAACACLAFVFLWEQVQAMSLGYEVGKTQKLMQKQTERNAYLRLQLARLNSPERLAGAAESRLKMIPPDPQNQIFLDRTAPRGAQSGYLSFLFRP